MLCTRKLCVLTFFLRQRGRTWNSHAHHGSLVLRSSICGQRARKKRYKLLKVNDNILPHNGYAL
jgi:hypothetical protein